MSFIAFVSFATATYLAARPFVKLRFLKKDVEDDLADYYRRVVRFEKPLLDIMLVLQENGLLDETKREGLTTAYRSLISIDSWDDVARSDRLAVESFDEAVRVLNASDVQVETNRYKSTQIIFNMIDEELIETRRLLHRDIPILNGSFVHKYRLLSKLMKVPTYPMSEPVQWYSDRKVTGPRLEYIYHSNGRKLPPMPRPKLSPA